MAEALDIKAKRYFVVNRFGAVHEVTREHAAELIAPQNSTYRMATPAEAKKYLETPVQRADQPIAAKKNVNPDAA